MEQSQQCARYLALRQRSDTNVEIIRSAISVHLNDIVERNPETSHCKSNGSLYSKVPPGSMEQYRWLLVYMHSRDVWRLEYFYSIKHQLFVFSLVDYTASIFQLDQLSRVFSMSSFLHFIDQICKGSFLVLPLYSFARTTTTLQSPNSNSSSVLTSPIQHLSFHSHHSPLVSGHSL
jgi:hypothetical protein